MIAFNKIGFHGGPAGNHHGIGDYYKKLDAAGVPFVIKSVDHYGHIFEASQYSNAPHVLAFRLSTEGQPDSYDYDVPNYSLSPAEAASRHWAQTLSKLPPEFNKDKVWLEPINEVDKERSDWLGRFAFEIGKLALRDGYKLMMFGWSAGEPEPEHWEEPGMLAYLRMCEENPDSLGVSLHEYSYDVNDIWRDRPSLVGRFERLIDACTLSGIAPPKILISEWGWTYRDAPPPDLAMADIKNVADFYADYPQVIGAATWYLGGGDNWGWLSNEVQKLIAPVTEFSLTYRKEVDDTDDTPPPTEVGNDARVPYKRTYVLIPPGRDRAWARAVVEETWDSQRWTIGGSADDGGIGNGLLERRVVAVNPAEWGQSPPLGEWYPQHYANVQLTTVEASDPNILRLKLRGMLNESERFYVEYWPCVDRRITQIFGINQAYYAQFGLPGHEGFDIAAKVGDRIAVVADGVVTNAFDDDGKHNYGTRVYVAHGKFTTVYAHLSKRFVKAGDVVKAGQIIGLAGETGNTSGPHLHWVLKYQGATASKLTIYPSDIIDPTSWLRLDAPISNKPTPADETPPPVTGVSNPAFGLHTSADAHNLAGDLRIFELAKPKAVKILSSYRPEDIPPLIQRSPGAKWIVRAFLKFDNGRVVSPGQFINDTMPDTKRSVSVLRAHGISPANIAIELHNEPNLSVEGLDANWSNGQEFGVWLLAQLDKWRSELPGHPLLFPGLSPGGTTPWRVDSRTFLEGARTAIGRCDGLGVHAYWSPGYPMTGSAFSGLGVVDDAVSRFPGKKIWITEASNNTKATAPESKAREYIQFWKDLKKRPNIEAVTYFVVSARGAQWNWVEGGSGETWKEAMAVIAGGR